MNSDPDRASNASGQKVNAQAGDVVLTHYGIAVCVRSPHNELPSLFKARLWRVPGKSVGSAAVAFLNQESVRPFKYMLLYILYKLINLFHISSAFCRLLGN